MKLELLKSFDGFDGADFITSSPDGLWFIIAGEIHQYLYNTENNVEIVLGSELEDDNDRLSHHITPQNYLVTLEENSTTLERKIIVWEWNEGDGSREITSMDFPFSGSDKVFVNPAGTIFAIETGELAGQIKAALYSIPDARFLQHIDGQSTRIGFLKDIFWGDNKTIILVDQYGQVLKIGLEDNVVLQTLQFANRIMSRCVSPNAELFGVFVTEDNPYDRNPDAKQWLELWHIDTKSNFLKESIAQDDFAMEISFSPDSKLMVVRFRKALAIYDAITGIRQEYMPLTDEIKGGAVYFLNNGHLLVQGDNIRIYALKN